MEEQSIAIIILNWNGKKWLEQFLQQVVDCSQIPGADVYVADNASTDDSVSYLKSNFPKVKVMVNSSNEGYAGGYNWAIDQVKEKYVCLLNSDIEVTKDWLKPILEMFKSDSSIAAIQPKILDFNQKNKFEYAGAAGGFIDWLGYPFARGRIFDTIEEDKNQYNSPTEIFWASGACLFVDREKFVEAGRLDETLFAHQEEIDLCWRMKNLGYKIYYQPLSKVYHVGGGSLPYGNARKTYLNFRNNLIILLKNYPFPGVIPVLLIRFFLDLFASIFLWVKTGKMAEFLVVLKAMGSFYGRFFSLLSKRPPFSQQKMHPEMIDKSFIINYYIFKKRFFSDFFS